MEYLPRFESLKNEIESNPLFELVEFKKFPPVEEATLRSVEDLIESPLDGTIRGFYKETNGLVCRWRVRPTISKEDLFELRKFSNDVRIRIPESPESPFSKINLLPLEKAVLYDWQTEIHFGGFVDSIKLGGIKYEINTFFKLLKPFDLYSENDCMAFIMEKGVGNPKLIGLTNYYIDWQNSKITDFESYLEMLLATRGISEFRSIIFEKEDGFKQKPITGDKEFWEQNKFVPKIFGKK